jgi:hypothetical protein
MSTAAPARRVYPLRMTAGPPVDLSRWFWLVKWLLALPHAFLLAVLWGVYVLLTLVALIAIVATGRYPRSIFDVNVGILRWSWRVSYYAYGVLGSDRYPPFTFEDDPAYPARLTVDYPQELSRGLALVKWWLLAIPHYIVVGIFVGPQVAWEELDGTRYESQVGLISVLVLIAAIVLAVTSRYPLGLHDLLLGLHRWIYRVVAYASLMTDEYPPFRLDLGPEPDRSAVPPPP